VRGEAAYNTTWEALAVLVAMRLWREAIDTRLSVEVRSDSLAALGAIAKRTAAPTATGLGLVVAELALDEAELDTGIDVLTHIPGISNTWADALSRLEAPESKEVPSELREVPRAVPPRRREAYWLTRQDPRQPRRSAASHADAIC
jgi:hypothetical protein